MTRSVEEIKKDIITLTRVPSVFINEKLKELADEVENIYQQGYSDGFASVKDLGKLYSEIRAEAIDEFVAFANTLPIVEDEDGYKRPMRLEEMAEKLKSTSAAIR